MNINPKLLKDVNEQLTILNNKLDTKQDKGILLWTNPNPSSSFSAQTINNINLTDYKFIEIYYIRYSGENIFCNRVPFENTEIYTQLNYCDYDIGSVRAWIRNVRLRTNDIYFNTASINGNVDNSALVPYKIIGYKN